MVLFVSICKSCVNFDNKNWFIGKTKGYHEKCYTMALYASFFVFLYLYPSGCVGGSYIPFHNCNW